MADSGHQICWSAKVKSRVRQLGKKAKELGIARDFVQAIKTLNDRLRRDPMALGEMRWTRGNIEVRVAIHQFLAISFRVDKAKRLVLVEQCTALSGHGF